jgi:hypothetical protein
MRATHRPGAPLEACREVRPALPQHQVQGLIGVKVPNQAYYQSIDSGKTIKVVR